MKRGICFGLNEVLPAAYGGWQGWLKNPVNDARDVANFYARAGFDLQPVFNLDCTTGRLRSEIAAAAGVLTAGDTFMFFYSGHGGQAPAWTWSGYKETLCLADGQLADTALLEMFAAFQAGVRVVFISDSCHSGGMSRTIPPSRDMPNGVRSQVSQAFVRHAPISASGILVAACQSSELASDGSGNNGAFTAGLLQVADDFFKAANRPLTYAAHVEAIQRYMARDYPAQHPVVEHYGVAADWNVEVTA